MTKSMPFSQFQRNKSREMKDLEKALKGRLEDGHGNHFSLDLDLYPVLSMINSFDWSYTVAPSCSGTPTEHRRNGYGPENGLAGNANASLAVRTYLDHPMTGLFLAWFNNYVRDLEGASISGDKSRAVKGVMSHGFEIFVPESVVRKGDLKYLDRFWEGLRAQLIEFSYSCNARSEQERFVRSLPKEERVFLNLVKSIGEPVKIIYKNDGVRQEHLGKLGDVSPYNGVFLEGYHGGFPFKEGKGIEKISTWEGRVLFDVNNFPIDCLKSEEKE